MDQILFENACEMVLNSQPASDGIGTLQEKSVHSVIKNYLAPDSSKQEIQIEGFVADIFTGSEIIEVQTGNFQQMRRKLKTFLPLYPVTIAYPIHQTKWIRWINPQSGEISPPRKSPKRGSAYSILPELYKIKNFLLDPNLKLHIIITDMEDYRYLDGWGKNKKNRATKCDIVPTKLIDEVTIADKSEYKKLIPDSLVKGFTSKDYKKASRLSLKESQTALNILHHVGAVERVSKEGNAYIYDISKQ